MRYLLPASGIRILDQVAHMSSYTLSPENDGNMVHCGTSTLSTTDDCMSFLQYELLISSLKAEWQKHGGAFVVSSSVLPVVYVERIAVRRADPSLQYNGSQSPSSKHSLRKS